MASWEIFGFSHDFCYCGPKECNFQQITVITLWQVYYIDFFHADFYYYLNLLLIVDDYDYSFRNWLVNQTVVWPMQFFYDALGLSVIVT